jgi:hypothetical protein
MEYEIDDESRLFDDSTNPSLDHATAQAIENQSSVKPRDYPAEKRKLQRAVVIPEEEHQLG